MVKMTDPGPSQRQCLILRVAKRPGMMSASLPDLSLRRQETPLVQRRLPGLHHVNTAPRQRRTNGAFQIRHQMSNESLR
jgi:hypothetical protein